MEALKEGQQTQFFDKEVQEVQKAQEVKEVQGAPGELVMPAGPGMQVGTAKARRNGRS